MSDSETKSCELWESSNDIDDMTRKLLHDPAYHDRRARTSDRKLRLFVCAAYRLFVYSSGLPGSPYSDLLVAVDEADRLADSAPGDRPYVHPNDPWICL